MLKIISINQSIALAFAKSSYGLHKGFLFCILALTIISRTFKTKLRSLFDWWLPTTTQAKFGGLVAYIVAACKVVHEVFQHDNTSLAWDLEILRTRLHILPLVESVSKKMQT